MTDNFDFIKNYMRQQAIPETEKNSGDLFFNILLLRRGKDFPEFPSANYTFKSYYVDSIEKFDKVSNEIKACCDIFKLRAYVSVNVKSKEDFTKYCSMKFAENVVKNEYKKPWRVTDHVFGKLGANNEYRWIVDVDNVSEISKVIMCIKKCESRYDNPIITQLQTKSGIHIITHTFNSQKFKTLCGNYGIETPDIKKNHITLLYENI